MPELPEVENVKLSLKRLGVEGQVIEAVDLKRADLRRPMPKKLFTKLKGQTIERLERRAKYLLFTTPDWVVISHLGMTGSWRTPEQQLIKHDHVVVRFQSGLRLVYNDPRRFGVLDVIERQRLHESPWLNHLGVEPLDESFTASHLFAITRKSRSPIKSVLMDQRRVVGVGNIYASEALFFAGVRPTRLAGRLKLIE